MLADIGGLFLLPFALLAVGFWLWMIVDCVRHGIGDSLVTWLLLLLLVGAVGAPLYFFLRRLPRQRTARFQTQAPIYQPWPKHQRIR